MTRAKPTTVRHGMSEEKYEGVTLVLVWLGLVLGLWALVLLVGWGLWKLIT